MNNASFNRSDPRDTTRGGVSLAPHADRIVTLLGVKQKALWPSMERSAMKHYFVAQKVSLLEWLYNAPQKVCVRTYPKLNNNAFCYYS